MTTHTHDRPSSRSGLAAWYKSALAEQERSGLSVADFAARIGVNPVTLYAWRRRLAGAASRKRSRRTAAGLVQVRVVADDQPERPAQPATAAAPLVVRVGRSRGIEVPAGFDAAELARLIGVLESC